MSEAKTTCPICAREPGEQHTQDCPRSMVQQRRLQAQAKATRRGRVLWVSALLLTKREMEAHEADHGSPLKGVSRTRHAKPEMVQHATFGRMEMVPLFKVPAQGQYVRAVHGELS